MATKMNGKDLSDGPVSLGGRTSIEGLLFDPLYKTNNYALVILAPFLPELGTGVYGVVNRDTKVVEVSGPQYPAAKQAVDDLQAQYEKVVLDDDDEIPF
jgi:hypothetical protein